MSRVPWGNICLSGITPTQPSNTKKSGCKLPDDKPAAPRLPHALNEPSHRWRNITARCLNGTTTTPHKSPRRSYRPPKQTHAIPQSPKGKASSPKIARCVLHGKVSIWCSSTTADWLLPHGQAWASPGVDALRTVECGYD